MLGVTIPAGGGKDDGEKVLDILAEASFHRALHFEELAQRFVADDPPPALIDRMAKTFLDTDGDIREVMKTMLDSKEFFSQGAYQAKVKTPFEMIVSAVRATGAQVDYAFPLANQIAQLGRASLPQAGADRLFERQRRMGQFGVAAGAHELRARSDAEQSAGRKVDQARFNEDPAHTARQMLFTNATRADAGRDRESDRRAEDEESQSRRHRRRWWRGWCSDRRIFRDVRS